jgi:ankyrin repeat protein
MHSTLKTPFHKTLAFKIVVSIPVVIVGLMFLQSEPQEWISPRSKRLLEAVKTNNLMTAATLLESGADPNSRAANGTTPLTLALQNDALGMLRLLIDKGADVNLPGPDGVSPLKLAVKLDKPQLVRLLLSSGASADERTMDGLAPLLAAAKSDAVRELLHTSVASAEPQMRR